MAGTGSAHAARDGGNPFLRAVGWISTIAGWVSAAMIVAAVAITCQMIFVRFVLNGSTVWQTEAVVYLMIAATLIGLPYVQRLRGHVNVDLIPIALKGGARRAMFFVTMALSIGIVGVMLFYAWEFWHLAWSRGWKSDTIWGVTLWKPYLSLLIGLGLLLLQLVADVVAVVLGHDDPFGLED
ncbi:TRAP transporter small permease [Jannaschia aquimarina]|uniref:TRAP transporter small permease protein n=1 Tax=Jannaschia aquimarina TaxID=935700 RepID=A0A0D1CS14_9RHOB|nr:TRAP transporter small permease subunit [Jannaschia aquimarina]KIT17592.1 Tripartite ATP-independent periplasmic transporter, DctQ component [Jannaschia aquimarina]SNS71953.1 TRAP-type C4-dicarboxylate transport system, small permease component [Jannaschia aquimarina]